MKQKLFVMHHYKTQTSLNYMSMMNECYLLTTSV